VNHESSFNCQTTLIMKKIIILVLVVLSKQMFAQKQTFDLVTYIPPTGWKKEIQPSVVSYSFINKKDTSWCQAGIFKSTVSKGSIEADFENEWNELVVKQYQATATSQTSDVQEAEGWKIKSGSGQFIFNNRPAAVLLTTYSGYGVCISIIATTASQRYLKNIEKLIGSVELKKPAVSSQPLVENSTTATVSSVGFAFTTTNFDDGWVGTEQADWVQVTKGNIKVLVHYPNKKTFSYGLLEGLKIAWDLLVAPRYSSISQLEFKPLSNWQPIEFAEADAIEKISGKSVHVVLFKMNYFNGSGKYIEFITPDKRSFEQEFGAYHQSSSGWEKMADMANYNKFAVAASDLKGKWTSDFSGFIQYVNAYTGADAGANTHASAENFLLGPGNTYKWDLSVASGQVGNIKFQSVKSSGKFSMIGNWQIKFSDIEGKPRTFNAYFSCIKGMRILWLDNKSYGKVE
jgi:hypothetical protein